jgi:phytoene dehydrogenase-like protein
MQIHVAMKDPPRWTMPELDRTAYLHVTNGLDGVARAVSDACGGLLPASSTIAVGQPVLVDPSRAPPGQAILWLQILDLPTVIRGDAAGSIAVPADGCWNYDVREAYADRVLKRLSRHIANLESSLLARRVLSPADLESLNVNLVGGDPFGGDCSLDQALFCRPLKGGRPWRTPVANVFHIGASTHPGHNLGAGSGFGLARLLT